MKSYRKELWFNMPQRRAFVNITPRVEACLQESGICEGFALVNANLHALKIHEMLRNDNI
jgi:thiamine phosphate synthase YjbQ (UPF0047 family)